MEAQRLEDTEFAAAAAQAREAFGHGPEADARLDALLVAERDRVAAAVAFAEVLAPMLSERLCALAPVRRLAGNVPVPDAPETRRLGEARGIADFIEEMLAQDRAGAH